MRRGVISLSGLFALGCSGESYPPLPAEADIRRLEAKLGQHRCIEGLGNWERNYRFRRVPSMFWAEHTDFGIIQFHFRRAGTVTLRPGRRTIGPAESWDWPDSPSIRSVSGSYNAKSGTVRMQKCGDSETP